MGDVLLDVQQLRVDYDEVLAVNDVSFSVEAGMVYGLIGPNGAGKTSIMKVLASLLEPTWGQVRINGVDLLLEPRRALQYIGYMPDFPPLYDDLSVREFLELFASAYGLPPQSRRSRIEALVAQVQLTEKLEQPCGGLSRGMKQRLFLAKTLLHDPPVLLLDEPASGLDPRARIEFQGILTNLGKQGKAVLVSSHILSELADFCNAVGIMEQGRMIVTGRIDEILAQLQPQRRVLVRLAAEDARLESMLHANVGVGALNVSGQEARFSFAGDEVELAELLRQLIRQDLPVCHFQELESNLQDIFMKVSTGRVA